MNWTREPTEPGYYFYHLLTSEVVRGPVPLIAEVNGVLSSFTEDGHKAAKSYAREWWGPLPYPPEPNVWEYKNGVGWVELPPDSENK